VNEALKMKNLLAVIGALSIISIVLLGCFLLFMKYWTPTAQPVLIVQDFELPQKSKEFSGKILKGTKCDRTIRKDESRNYLLCRVNIEVPDSVIEVIH
jgi:hypothetical protein